MACIVCRKVVFVKFLINHFLLQKIDRSKKNKFERYLRLPYKNKHTFRFSSWINNSLINEHVVVNHMNGLAHSTQKSRAQKIFYT